MLIKPCFVIIANVFYWLHIVYTCTLDTVGFSIAFSILTLVHYDCHIENGTEEEMMSLNFLM